MKDFTNDELNLMAIYNASGTRKGLIRELQKMRDYLEPEETELRDLTDSALNKLNAISDGEYAELDLYLDFDLSE